jgi:hypothetical protein
MPLWLSLPRRSVAARVDRTTLRGRLLRRALLTLGRRSPRRFQWLRSQGLDLAGSYKSAGLGDRTPQETVYVAAARATSRSWVQVGPGDGRAAQTRGEGPP